MSKIPKGYKQTEVGVIPSDWKVKKLGELVKRFVNGGTPSTQKENYWIGDIPWITGADIVNQKVAEIRRYITIEAVKSSSTNVIGQGNLLLVSRTGIGKLAIAPFDIAISQDFIGIYVNSEVLKTEYLYRYFDFNQAVLKSQNQGTSIQGITRDTLSAIPIPLPPTKAEQTAIANVLSDADALIGNLEKLIAKKRNVKQGAMQELLTGKKRLPGFSGEWQELNMAENSILKARIGWQGLTTAEYLKSGDYYLVTGTDFIVGRINWSNCFFVDESRYLQDKNIQLKAGDILLTKDGTIGKVAYVDFLPGPATLNSGVFVIRPKDNAYSPLFFYYILSSRIFDDFLVKLQAGSTISHLYQKDFVNFSFVAPRIEEQTAIAQILSDMDAEIEVLEQKLAKCRMIKQGMMQELLTGRIRLLDAVADKKLKATVTAIHEKYDSQKKKHNWEFNEAVVISVLAKTFGVPGYPLGRKRYTKLSYLLHRYAKRKAEGYIKKAAGPYNPDTKYGGPEKIAQTRGYIKAHSSGKYTGFIAGNNIDEAVAYFNKWYGQEILRWLEQFRYKNNDQLELLTTVDMAVQDLLQTKQEVSMTSVKTIIHNHNEWRDKLKRSIFSDDNIDSAIRLSEDLFRT